MSAPPGRSATVTSLSGRVNALKFMQRASPASTPTKSTTASTSASTSRTPASPSPAASPAPSVPGSPAVGGAEEEQWALSPAAIAKLRAKAQANTQSSKNNTAAAPTISHEAGFDAWLITREKQTAAADSKPTSRQTFGKLGKQKEDDEDDNEKEDEGESKKRSRSKHEDGLEPEFDSADSDDGEDARSSKGKGKGFVKPGTWAKSGTQDASPSAAKKAKKNAGSRSKDQDKVVFARKRGGKPGISGGGR